MIESSTGNFTIPPDFLGKEVVVRLAIPIMQNGLSFPEIQVVLEKDLDGALLMRQDDGDLTVLPKSRVWSISLHSEITTLSSKIIKPH
jgi:hypothetical protein